MKKTKKEYTIPKCILFDFDRTMVYLYKDKALLFELGERISNYYREYIPIEKVNEDGYFLWHDLHRIVAEKYNQMEAENINSLAEKVVTEFEREVVRQRPLFDDVADSLIRLSQLNIKLGIVSSNSTQIIKEKMRESNITCFQGIFGRILPFHPEQIKPSAYPLIHALDSLRENVEEAWYVGDDVIDIQAAKKAGMLPVGMATGRYGEESLLLQGAKLTFANMTEFVDYIYALV